MDEEIILHIGRLNSTNIKLMQVILFTIENEDEEKYEKLAQIFQKRAETTKILKEINMYSN